MFLNIIIGFILPWLLAYPLACKYAKLFLVMSPITAIIALLINTIGFYFDFWHFKPVLERNETISAIPLDLGLYAVLGSLMVYFLTKRLFGIPSILVFLLFVSFTTLLEYLALMLERVTYTNGWHIGWTFISYSTAFFLVVLAWRFVKSHIDLA